MDTHDHTCFRLIVYSKISARNLRLLSNARAAKPGDDFPIGWNSTIKTGSGDLLEEGRFTSMGSLKLAIISEVCFLW